MQAGFRALLTVVLAIVLTVLLLQPRGSYGKAGPLSPSLLIAVVVAAVAAATLARAARHPAWGTLLGGVAGGLAASPLNSPQGVIIGVVVGAIVALVPLPLAVYKEAIREAPEGRR